jgi:hypothetical protein
LDAFVAEFAMALFHPSSSCAMGKVVDNELRVMGVSGLRVADASIMPTIVRGNPNARRSHDQREGPGHDRRELTEFPGPYRWGFSGWSWV